MEATTADINCMGPDVYASAVSNLLLDLTLEHSFDSHSGPGNLNWPQL